MLARRGRAVEALEDVRHGRPRRCPGRGRARSARRRASVHLDGRAGAGSTWPRCRAGSRSRARGSPACRRRSSARARPRSGRRGGCRVARRIASSVSRSSRTSSSARLLLLAARELGQLARSASVISPSWATTSCEQLLALVRRQLAALHASTSMFVRRLVSGVRSSCEASWTSCRWRCCASSSDSSIALKVAASRLSSSLPLDLDPLRSGRASRGRARRSRSGRAPACSAARATRKPATERDPDPAERDEQQPEPDLGELVVDVRERRRDHGSRTAPGSCARRAAARAGR